MSKNIIIIGGGIIGLSCAYFLHKSGHNVTVIDQSKMDGGASYVNAGYLAPSHLVPLSAPGVMKQGIKWMLDSKSPLYIKPRFNSELIKWSWAFNKSCTSQHVQRVIPAMREIAVMGRDLYDQIKREEGFDFQLEKKGLLMLCQTEQTLHHEGELVEIAQKEGLGARMLSVDEVKHMMPKAPLDIIGATYFECDHHTTPGAFMNELKTYLINAGVVIRQEEKVVDFGVEKDKITFVKTNKEQLKADEYVLAEGSWESMLSRKLKINLLLQAG
jgi:D-amino-acid dehydrogenase